LSLVWDPTHEWGTFTDKAPKDYPAVWKALHTECGPNDELFEFLGSFDYAPTQNQTDIEVKTQIETLIHTGRFGVVLFYCTQDITPGFNGFFAVMPKRGYEYECGTVQWHRDVLPAINRWVKAHTNQSARKILSSTDSISNEESTTLLRNRINHKNNRMWLMFAWEPCVKKGYRSSFKEVNFE
jgi:hypothetical protein